MDNSIVYFKQVRENAFGQWIRGTERKPIVLSIRPNTILIDDFSNGKFECRWQNKAQEIKNNIDWHTPHFCSLGDWAGNVTDILSDFRIDSIPIGTYQEYDLLLFRYYTRFLLVWSELVDDLVILFEKISGQCKGNGRKKLSTSTMDVNELFKYINSICKHKADSHGNLTKLHQCNHHLPFFFEDSGLECPFTNPVGVGKNSIVNPDGLIVPRLNDLVAVILNSYTVLNKTIDNNPENFKKFISENGIIYQD